MNSIFEYQETPGKRGRPKKEESQPRWGKGKTSLCKEQADLKAKERSPTRNR